MTDEPIFISSPVNVLHGDAASVALQTTNDAAYMAAGLGVLSVPLERWQQAQQYERSTWLEYGLNVTEDRNTEHANEFAGYAALPENIGTVIEIGCGAFTNVHQILIRGHSANHIILIDPLAEQYQAQHPHCTYRDGTLAGVNVQVVAHPIEYPQTWIVKADTVVMINTLSHCMNAETVFTRIRRMLKKGGYLVFHEPARDIDPAQCFDVGHPLSYNQTVLDSLLRDFAPVYQNGAYFIGTRR